jgi:hypothetical protein
MRAVLALAGCLLVAGTAPAQTDEALAQAHARVTTIVNFTTVYVGELLIACAAAGALTDAQAEERFQSYRSRNDALVARVESWSREAELKLQGQDGARAARERAREAGQAAVAGGSLHAQREIGAAADARALCAARVAAIDAGAFDLARSAELLGLLRR